MTITLDATAAATTANSTTLTISAFTATSGALIRVDVGTASDTDVTSVTYDGNSLTEVFDQDLVTVANLRLASYIGLLGADGTANDVVVTWGTNPGAVAQGARVSSWLGVEMSSVAASHRTIYSGGDDTGVGVDVTVVDSQSGDVVVSATMSNHTAITPGQTTVGVSNNIAGDGKSLGVQYTTASGASTVMSWTDDVFNTHVAYALVPSGAAAPEGPKLRVVRSPIRIN